MSDERLYKFTTAEFSLKDTGEISGIAWPFGGKADRVGDTIAPEAFKYLEGSTLPMLFAHQGRETVGVWSSLKAAEKGFVSSGRLLIDHIARAKEVAAMIKAGAANFLSLGFFPKAFRRNANGGRHFTLIDACRVLLLPQRKAGQGSDVRSGAHRQTRAIMWETYDFNKEDFNKENGQKIKALKAQLGEAA